jgi:hypothetical protein
MFSMKHLLMGVYQICLNKSPWVKIGPAGGGGVIVFRYINIMTLMLNKTLKSLV